MSQTCYKTIACLLSFTLIVATLILFSTFADTQDNTKVFLILLEIFILLMVCPGGYQDERSQINDRRLPAITRQETLEFSIDLDNSNEDLLLSYEDPNKNSSDNATIVPKSFSEPVSNSPAGHSLVHRQTSLPTYMEYSEINNKDGLVSVKLCLLK